MGSWLNFDEALDYLNCERDYLKMRMEQKEVPYSILPGTDIVRFNIQRLDEWLLGYEVTPKTQKNYFKNKEKNMLFIEEIINRFRLITKQTIKYTNIYRNSTERKVYAQLHPSNNGIDIAIKEAGKNDNLPVCSHLKRCYDIENLSGCWRANKSWLLGDGKRFTNKRAAAFHISAEIIKDPNHAGWNEIEALINYAL